MAATASRCYFINWHSKKLQVSDLNGGAVSFPNFNKYETVPFKFVIVQPDTSAAGLNKFSRVDISGLSLTVTINDTYDDASPLVSETSWTKDETTNTFSGELALNTAGMNSYIGSNDTITAYLEVEIQDGTARSKILTQTVTLQNAVTQTAITAPTPLTEYYTKDNADGRFVQKIMPAGEQITITSPGGTYQRIIGVDDGGNAIDTILPV